MLNVQEREAKKPTKPASLPAAMGGEGGGAGVGGGGLTVKIGEGEVVNGTSNGRANFSMSSNVENAQPSAILHHTLATPTLHHHHQQQPPPPTQPVTKPKFQVSLHCPHSMLPSAKGRGGGSQY